jgi:hypothetical protein
MSARKEVLEGRGAPQVEAGPLEQPGRVPVVQRRVGHVLHRPPQLGVALGDPRVSRDGVAAAMRGAATVSSSQEATGQPARSATAAAASIC